MLILAPLRGVTVRVFRETFAAEISAAGFTEALTPFIPAMKGYDPRRDRELAGGAAFSAFKVTPQFIGKDPEALREALKRIKEAGFDTADLNAGCPYPMVRNKGRGAGLLGTPEVLRRMLSVGCEILGEGKFSLKTRLGLESPDELEKLLPLIEEFPLRFLTIHVRTAREMYSGEPHYAAFERIAAGTKLPLVLNGDLKLSEVKSAKRLMIGRGFIRSLGEREDSRELLARYLEATAAELNSDHSVLGRLKELLSYWQDLPFWHRRWEVLKLVRTLGELRQLIK